MKQQIKESPLKEDKEPSPAPRNLQIIERLCNTDNLLLVHNMSCEYHKSSDELLEDLKADLDPEVVEEAARRRLTIQRMPSLPMNNPPTVEDLSILFKRGSFVSAEDFRVSLAEVGEVVEGKWITPKPLKSRTTSYGRPDH